MIQKCLPWRALLQCDPMTNDPHAPPVSNLYLRENQRVHVRCLKFGHKEGQLQDKNCCRRGCGGAGVHSSQRSAVLRQEGTATQSCMTQRAYTQQRKGLKFRSWTHARADAAWCPACMQQRSAQSAVSAAKNEL